MIDITRLTTSIDKLSMAYAPDLLSVINSNLDTRHQYYSSLVRAVPTTHPVCELLRGLRLTPNTSLSEVVERVPDGLKRCELVGFGTSQRVSQGIYNAFFKGHQFVMAVDGAATDAPIRVLWHDLKDLSLPVVTHLPNQDTALLVVSVLPLALQYREWLVTGGGPLEQFVAMRVLPGLTRSYTSVSLFNILTSPTLDLVTLADDGRHPFATLSEWQYLQRVHAEYNRKLRYRRHTLRRVVSSLPALDPLTELFDVERLPSVMQVYWFKIAVTTLVFQRLTTIPADAAKTNRGIIGRYLNLLSILKRSGAVPASWLSGFLVLHAQIENLRK